MLAGAWSGFAFLTKMLQAFLVLPAFALVYLVESRLPFRRNIGQLLAAFGAWWSPAAGGSRSWSCGRRTRPYIGGSQNDSILELTLGYNGLGRLTGDETGSVGGGGGPGGGGWGETGLLRLFDSEIGGQIAWLLPAALLAAGQRPVGCAGVRRARTPLRAALVAVGRLAPRHRASVQPHGRHLPRLLHRRTGSGHRRGRRRSARTCCGTAHPRGRRR